MVETGELDLWLTAAMSGDWLALAKLLAFHHPRLAARVGNRLDPALAARTSPEDVLQEAYLQVFRQIGRFEKRGPSSFLNWVITILDSRLIDARRAAHRAQRDVAREQPPVVSDRSSSYWDLLDHVYRDTATPSRIARRDEAIGALLACVSELSESQRRVIELRFLEGRPLPEVAQQLGRSEGAVVALTQRALKTVRASMDRMGEFTGGA